MTSIADLSHNLANIHNAVSQDPLYSPDKEAINYCEEELYWKISSNFKIVAPPAESIKDAFGGGQSIAQKISDTHTLFHKCLAELAPTLDLYDHFLRLSCNGQYVSDEMKTAAKIAGDLIFEFYQATRPFLRQARTHPRAQAIFKKHFCVQCYDSHIRIRLHVDIRHLHCDFSYEYPPYKLIVDLACGRRVDVDKLDKFAISIATLKIESGILHRGMKAIVKFAKLHLLASNEALVDKAERALVNKQHELAKYDESLRNDLFWTPNNRRIEWINTSLRPGYLLTSSKYQDCDSQSVLHIHHVVVGERLGSNSLNSVDRNIYFKVTSHHETQRIFVRGKETLDDILHVTTPQARVKFVGQAVLWVSCNEALIEFLDSVRDTHWPVLPLPKTYYVDPRGQFAVVAACLTSLVDPPWREIRAQEKYKNLVVDFLKKLCEAKKMPRRFQARHVMLGANDRLYTSKIMHKTGLIFSVVETFAYQAALYDPTLFIKYVNESGLYEHPQAQLCRKAALSTFNEKALDIVNAARDINRPGEVSSKEAKDLIDKMKSYFTDCCEMIQYARKETLSADQRKEVQQLLLDTYKSRMVSSFLTHELKEEVKEAYLKQYHSSTAP